MFPAISAARLAAVLLVVLATILSAQNASTGQVVIAVVDQSGAAIPGARIGIIQLPIVTPPFVVPSDADWLQHALHAPEQVSTRANSIGEATVRLNKGSYALSITAQGFARYLERIDVRDESSQPLRATLVVSPNVRGDCMSCAGPDIPLEHPILNFLIPLESLQTITLSATRVRRR